MKLVKRQELMNEPDGTVFSNYIPMEILDLSIKTETMKDGNRNTDFYLLPLIESFHSIENLEEGRTQWDYGSKTTVRDGMYDDEDQYIVWEDKDVDALIKILKNRKEGKL